MGTLYVSTLPSGGLDDWPLRAQRRLPVVSLVIAGNLRGAQEALRGLPLAAPLVGMAGADTLLSTLETGDAMLLLEEELAGPSDSALTLIRAAVERGFAVESLPGPSLPVTALVVSGLPADGFVYLGRLPADAAARHDLLASVAAEKRTLVLATSGGEPGLWESLYGELGARPAALYVGAGPSSGVAWRGVLGPEGALLPDSLEAPCALVIGGATELPAQWPEDRLGAEIQSCLGQGMSPSQAAKHLAAPSGWPRREIYRRAVQAGSPRQEESDDDRIR